MPQPLPRGKNLNCFTGPDYMLQRPALAAMAGNVCANFALVEGRLVGLYALLLGMTLEFKPVAPGAPMIHAVAFQIFDALNSVKARLDLLQGAFDSYGTIEEAKHFRDKLSPEVMKCFNQRSIIAHGEWCVHPDYPDALILNRLQDVQQIWNRKDFEVISGRIVDLFHALMVFHLPILARARSR
jgi:hypothetical protein